MIHYIDKPGHYRTFSDAAPVLLAPAELTREECKPLIFQIVAVERRLDIARALLLNHGATSLTQVSDDALPVLLAELRAALLVLGSR